MTLNCLFQYPFDSMYPEFLKLFIWQDKETFTETANLIKDYWSYKTPTGYLKWSEFLIRMKPAIEVWESIIKTTLKTLSIKDRDKEEDSAVLIGEAFRHFTPPICVHENIIPALLQTDVKSMDPPEYAFPFFLFLLPKNFKTICGLPKHENYDLDFQAVFVGQLPPDCIGVAYVSRTTICYGVYEWSNPFSKEDENAQKQDFILEKFTKNLILTLSYESKYFTEEIIKTTTRGKGFGSKTKFNPAQVRWLGKNYTQTKQRIVYMSNKEATDSERFVRPHWRRGHWHTVCCGIERKQRKQQWYKPVFVNAG